ncbi:helix-turn-helix domain-containing protein [Proteus mirabilis]|uniref:helix-turn-helix domain-containing protein n=1 Tax=Morganellaceae TaxID=1903414 RepID=UPI001FAC2E40|nr:helix-turn-helix transcriptional regulator [Proteus mirabilis]MCI9740285.1 helix-turn-helix transcriptional regulator [Proteus mirabilis]MCI9754217.1 helix-turn-helix transcriptional regulator [Proteus mirabilis]MCI9764894.1 helix-turn-helix transcriptional regulator [Proteus mirabilis]MCI9783074.1 helix-turn-helix transcriptional regulator [Proteus mirabilis]MDX4950821.1 helix-turn-helix transcriptional regulator [Proteus mirabilis]
MSVLVWVKKIKEVRKSVGLSGNELGKVLGLSQQQVSRYERGESPITIDILIRISNALNVSVNELIIDYLNHEHSELLITYGTYKTIINHK